MRRSARDEHSMPYSMDNACSQGWAITRSRTWWIQARHGKIDIEMQWRYYPGPCDRHEFGAPREDWDHIAIVTFPQPLLYTWALRPLMMLVHTRMVMDCHPFAWLRIIKGGGFRWSWGDFLVIVVFSENEIFWWNLVLMALFLSLLINRWLWFH